VSAHISTMSAVYFWWLFSSRCSSIYT